MKLLSIIASVLLLAAGSVAQSCSIWNQDSPGSNWLLDQYNGNFHSNGEHYYDSWHSGTCWYQSPVPGPPGAVCIATLNIADIPSNLGEEGDVTGWHHVLTSNQETGSSTVRGEPTATAKNAFGVGACPIGACNISVNIGGVVTLSPGSTVWGATNSYNDYCPQELMGCPLIIDTAGEGIQLTDALDGVVTDMVVPGKPIRFGWTKRGSHNGFLWVDNHLFGNFMGYSDGYGMLASYDTNGDGVVDKKDGPAFDKFRIWIDANHDGTVQPEELHTLASLGIPSLPLAHSIVKSLDANGNMIYDKGTINTKAGGGQTMIDAFLATSVHPK